MKCSIRIEDDNGKLHEFELESWEAGRALAAVEECREQRREEDAALQHAISQGVAPSMPDASKMFVPGGRGRGPGTRLGKL